jgi:hypothetical protein
MPNWRKVIVSGSDASLYSLNVANGITGSLFGTASYTLTASYVNPLHQIVEITSSTTAASLLGSGSGLFTVDGTRGRIFTIDDTNSGSLFSVVTGSVPILEVFSSQAVIISGSLNVSNGITGSLLGSASYAITASYALNGGSGGGTVYVMDQGNNQGTASYFNFIGTGVTSSITNGTASISIPGTIVTGSNAILVQTTPATTWSFAHNLGEQFPVFTIFDSNNNVIVPLNINAYSANAASIYWSFPATGKAVAANCGLSGSIQTSSFAESASYAFTASYVQNAQTASYILNAISSSYAITSSFAYVAISASYAPSSDTSISASYAATASSADSFIVRNSLTASGLFYPATDGAYEFQVLQTNAAGNLSFGDVSTTFDNIYNGETTALIKGTPVYVSGSNGANPKVYRADAANASKMPVVYIVSEEITTGNTGRGITLGHIEGIDLTGYAAGTSVYVAAGGGWTSTRPTGSNVTIQFLGLVTKEGSGGKGLVLNPGPATLPNIQTGYTWIGNGNSYPLAVSTSSLLVTSASYAQTASYVENAQTASYILNAVSASYAISSSYAASASYALSASQAANATLFNSLSSSQFAQLTIDNTFTGNNIFSNVTASNVLISNASITSASIEYLYVIYQTSSIIYSSGSNQFGDASNDVQTLWGQVDIKSGPVTVTGSINASGGITGSLQGSASYALSSSNATTASYSNTSTSASYALSASYAVSSSYAFSASHALQAGGALFAESASNAIHAETIFPYTGIASITGSLVVTDTIALGDTLSTYNIIGSSAAGGNNLFDQVTGSYTSAFFKYTVSNGANARAGELMAVWNGSTTNYTDVSTTDIGNTSAVTCSAAILGNLVQFNITTGTSGWKIKSLATYI